MKKAKEFMAAGMFPQAIELLKKRINDKPTDAEAHYTLGVCYINTGNFSQAEERFASAVRLEPDYGFKIGGDFKKVADDALKQWDLDQAERLYHQALKYNPKLADAEFQKQLGYRCLKKAVESSGATRESYKGKAAGYVGDDLVAKVFPPGLQPVVFHSDSFTIADRNEHDDIPIIQWTSDLVNKLRVGDFIIIECSINNQKNYDGPIAEFYVGKHVPKDKRWVPFENGKFSWEMPGIPKVGKRVYIYIPPDKPNAEKVVANVSIVRYVESEPNVEILNDFIR